MNSSIGMGTNILEKISAFGPYALILTGLGATVMGSKFGWHEVVSLGGQVAAGGLALMTQQMRAVLNNKEGGQVNINPSASPANQ